ncbi:alkene reductase [Parvularcula lutaonensis]|uniref:Alkene reductase n=1 Tax=Parvularcula lutaonensis TaxID=491923 RepID=A0ABV7M9L0_9PROT|nr:alkene reductase [Parvularcula lutaonensis]GGY47326.1 alkene reductase [Parvularcula lutaonensis]
MADTKYPHLFESLTLGSLELPHRVLMAPLTRNRARADGVHNVELASTYYTQRAGAGLIVSEATEISPLAKGYIDVPGIYRDAHVDAWQKITDSVHEAGGRIFCQLWHCGRISHTSLLPENQVPVSASAIRADAQVFTRNGFEDCSQPRALETEEIPGVIAEYRHAAEMAKAAGFDGVEVHAANGYLLDQFLHQHTNNRNDAYGGSPENRARLAAEVVEASAEVWGADRVGIRLSPTGKFSDMNPEGMEETVEALFKRINPMGLAYLHVVEKFPGLDVTEEEQATLDRLHDKWAGTYIANGDFDAQKAEEWIARGRADAVTFGRLFIANPDLPERFRRNAKLNEPNPDTFYGGGAEGYTDYPFLDE